MKIQSNLSSQDHKVLQRAYDFFKDIPSQLWITEYYEDVDGNCCASGLLRKDYNKNRTLMQALDRIIEEVLGGCLESLNDGDIKEYNQTTPKERVMAFLEDALAMGEQ